MLSQILELSNIILYLREIGTIFENTLAGKSRAEVTHCTVVYPKKLKL